MTKNVVVKDVNGSPLDLLGTRMLERQPSSARRWTVTYAEILKAVRRGVDFITIEARRTDNPQVTGFVERDELVIYFDADLCRIGCHTFDAKTFNKILKKAGVKK